MQKILSVIMVVFFSMTLAVNAFAEISIPVDGLTDAQKAQLALTAENMKKDQTGKTTAEKVNEWVDVGKNIGSAVAASAKEIGIAADQFLNTKAGKITLFLIVWKVIGKDMMHFVVGFMLFATFVPLWVYFFRRLCVVKVKTVEYPEKGKGILKKKTYEYYDTKDDNQNATRGVMLVVLVVCVAVNIWIMI